MNIYVLDLSLPRKMEKAENVAKACEEALTSLLSSAGMSGMGTEILFYS